MDENLKERRNLSHQALVDSAIRSSKQLATSSDALSRSLGNRIFADLTQLRRQMPQRRLNENPPGATSKANTPLIAKASARLQVVVGEPQRIRVGPSPGGNDGYSLPAEVAPKPDVNRTPWDDLSAARDALDDNEADWHSILDLHRTRTLQRLKSHANIVCLFGEHAFEFAHSASTPRDAHLQMENSDKIVSLPLNTIYTLTPQREPLGMIDAWMPSEAPLSGDHATAAAIHGYEQVAQTSAKISTSRLLFVAAQRFDLGLFNRHVQSLGTPADWLVGAPSGSTLNDLESIWDRVHANHELGGNDFTLSTDGVMSGREMHLRLWSARMEVQIGSEKFWATCLCAREIDKTSNSTLNEWRLLSNRSAPDLASATELVRSWMTFGLVNEFNKLTQRALDGDRVSGCLEPRFPLKLMINAIVTFRIAHLRRHAYTNPEMDAEPFFTADEIRGIELLTNCSSSARTGLAQMLRLLTKLGEMEQSEALVDPHFEELHRGWERLLDAVTLLRRLA